MAFVAEAAGYDDNFDKDGLVNTRPAVFGIRELRPVFFNNNTAMLREGLEPKPQVDLRTTSRASRRVQLN